MPEAQGAGGPLLSRRTLLGSAAALTAAGVLGARPGRAEAATGLLRIVDLGQGATLHPGSPADLREGDNRALLAESGTAAVRLWADWPMPAARPGRRARRPREPRRAVPRGARRADRCGQRGRPARRPASPTASPLWANGTAELAAVRGTDAEISFAYADRIAPAAWARYVAAGRDPRGVTPFAAGRSSSPSRPRAAAPAPRGPRCSRSCTSATGPAARRPVRSSTDRARQRAQLPALAPTRPVADRRPVRARPGRRAAHRREMMASARAVSRPRGTRAAAHAVVRRQQLRAAGR